MRFTYLSAHCVQGIAHPIGEPDIPLFENAAQGIRVFLTSNAVARLHLLNRHMALLSMMFRGMIGSSQATDFSDRLAEEVEKVNQQRLDSIGNYPVVIIELKGDIDTKIPTITREIQDFVICFDAFDKQALRAQLQAKVSAVLTALRIGAAEGYEFRHVSDGSYLTDDSGRIVYSVSMEGGTAELLISRRLTPEQCAQIATDIPLTLKAGTLERVIRLHAQSLNKAIDNYRAFISAWSALEIFIGKLFPAYQRLLSAELRSVNQAPGLHAYLDRIAKVMGDKHNIADKFAVLSVYLDDNQNGDEVRKFLELKSFRDRLSHGEELDESTLPTRDVQRLFDKYLRNHMRRDA